MAAPRFDRDKGPSRFRLGVRVKTLSGLAVLLAILLAISVVPLVKSWRTLRAIGSAQTGNALAGDLIESGLKFAAERGITNGVLTSPLAIDRAGIADILDHRRGGLEKFDDAKQRIAANPAILSATTRSELLRSAENLSRLREMVDVEIQRPLSERDPKVSAVWVPTMSAFLELLRQALGELSGPVTASDAELQAIREARMAAFDMRNVAGGRAALISGVLGAGEPIGTTDAIMLGSRREASYLHWSRLQRLAATIPDERLATCLVDLQNSYFGGYAQLLDNITESGLSGRPYPVPLRTFREQTAIALDGMDAVVLLTQTMATEMLDHRLVAAKLRLYGSLAAVLAGLGVACVSVIVFNRRVLRPIEEITKAMRRLSVGSAVSTDLPVAQADEIGDMSRAIAAFRDAIIASETALFNAERFTHQTIDTLSSQIAVLDEDGLIVATNKSWREFSQTDSGPRIAHEGQNYLLVCDRSAAEGDDVAEAIATGIRQLLAGGCPEREAEYPCHGPDRQRWFHMRATRFANSGFVRVVVAHDDITARKLAEEGLREKNRLLELAGQMSSTGYWRFERTTGLLRWSSEIYRIYGVSPDDFSPNSETALDAYHPADRQRIAEVAREAIRSGIGIQARSASLPCRRPAARRRGHGRLREEFGRARGGAVRCHQRHH